MWMLQFENANQIAKLQRADCKRDFQYNWVGGNVSVAIYNSEKNWKPSAILV